MAIDQLNLGILIKCHLPLYKNGHQQYILPFSRLHIIRDFHNLIQLLKKHSSFPITLCITPSIYLQIKEFIGGEAEDILWELALRDPETMGEEQKSELLKHFFALDNPDDLTRWPGFSELLKKYVNIKENIEEEALVREFSDQEYRDLQVWFLLSWLGIFAQKRQPFADLINKDKGYSEDEKKNLFYAVIPLIEEVLQFIKEIDADSQRDLIFTPFYHPIMPIIQNSDIVRQVNPGLEEIPKIRLANDAEWHVKHTQKYFNREFGKKNRGFFLPEGAVSDDILSLVSRFDFSYTLVNENIMKNTLRENFNPISHLYSPLAFTSHSGKNLPFFVIDGELDDKINMVYPFMDTNNAVEDFGRHLAAIRKRIQNSHEDLSSFMVTFVFNLETLWSKYQEHGTLFLDELLSSLGANEDLNPILHEQFKLDKRKLKKITSIMPNTKYNDRFQLWIGNEEDNIAWDYLLEARGFLEKQIDTREYSKEVISEAWEHIHIAQSSDWWWWFGEENYGRYEMDFDKLFRGHLMRVYEIMEQDVPEKYFQAIKWRHFRPLQSIQPKGAVKPIIDGSAQPASEWNNAVKYNCFTKESILKETSGFKNLYIGYDKKYLFLRIDFSKKIHILTEIVISFYTDKKEVVIVSPFRGTVVLIKNSDAEPQLSDMKYLNTPFAFKEIFEIMLPIKTLHLKSESNIRMQFSLKLRREELTRFPYLNMIDLYLPPEDMR